MHDLHVAIIGAGVVGLSVAAQVARRQRKVLVIEKKDSFGQETSSRNSGVIHAGLYYPSGSLKARLCVEGNVSLYALCKKNSIPHAKPGKLIVASTPAETERVERLMEMGHVNGASGLEMVSAKDLKALEPNVQGVAALISRSTGLVDSYSLMRFLAQQAASLGAILAYRAEVAGIEKSGQGYKINVRDPGGLVSFSTRVVVNCAGLNAGIIAGMAGIDVEKGGYRQHYCKGKYFRLDPSRRGFVNRPVYPAPEPGGAGLGIHITPDLNGDIRLGPDAQYVDEVDYSVDDSEKEHFYTSARTLLPKLKRSELQPDFAGIRPKLQGPGEDFRDFVIRHEADRGLPGLIDLVGIESPGLTASPAIGRYVARIVSEAL